MPVDEEGREPTEPGYKGPPNKNKKGTKWWAEMVGPLPVGAWLAILAIGIGYSFWHRKNAATTDNSAVDPTADQTVGMPNYADGSAPNPWQLGGAATAPGDISTGYPGVPGGPYPITTGPGASTPTPAAAQSTSDGVVTAQQASSPPPLSASDQQQIASLQQAGLQPVAISYGQSAGGSGPSTAPAAVPGTYLAPLPESAPGVFPYAAVPVPAGGVFTGAQAVAIGGTPYYNPNPGYGHSAYGTF